MFGSGHLIAGMDVASGPFALMVFSAAAAAVVVAVLVRLALRRFGYEGPAGIVGFCAVALVGGTVIYLALDNVATGDQTAERRTIEARAAELTARALTPGSPLGCLDAVENVLVENACEKSVFASAEAVAAAVAYVDARLSLLPASASLARRDPTYRPSYERLRRGLEADRYGVVAHVLTTRGCNVADCPEIHLLGDSPRVLANIKDHAFEAALGVHALGWANGGGNGAVASVQPITPPMALPSATTGVGPPMASTAPVAPVVANPKFEFPSASSIPAVSIMNPEPGPPANSEGKRSASAPSPAAAPLPSKRQAVMSRKPNTHEAAAPQPPSAPPANAPRAPSLAAAPVLPPPPPVQITPPEPASAPDEPDPHATH